jgi:glyoxylase-like metal-dependent hydrolase (beta-lactamase superfamily II)
MGGFMELSRRGFLKGITALSGMAALADFGAIAHAVERVSVNSKGLTKIADGIYSYIDEKNPTPARSFGANAGIIIGRDGIVVIDTLISSKEAQKFISDIRAVSDMPIKYVINTHYHLDHALGNADFIRHGATVVSHKNCKKNINAAASTILQRAKNYGLTDEMMQGTKVAEPSLTFNSGMGIDLGDRRIELIYTNASHTDGSIVIYAPDTKTLFAGDILFTGFHPYMGDADIAGWIKVLDHIASLDVAAIVPGHGPLSTKKDILEMREYLMTFDSIGRGLSAQGKDAKYIAAEILKATPKREFFDMFVEGNVAAKYLKK